MDKDKDASFYDTIYDGSPRWRPDDSSPLYRNGGRNDDDKKQKWFSKWNIITFWLPSIGLVLIVKIWNGNTKVTDIAYRVYSIIGIVAALVSIVWNIVNRLIRWINYKRKNRRSDVI